VLTKSKSVDEQIPERRLSNGCLAPFNVLHDLNREGQQVEVALIASLPRVAWDGLTGFSTQIGN
jgi:hypothetical protein